MREAHWLWALSLRRWRRMLQRFVVDAAVRKKVMTAWLGLGGGCLPLIWFFAAMGNPGGTGPDFPEGGVFGVALLVVWSILLQPALAGHAIILPRPGLTLVLSGPITGRGLLAWWASRAWVGMAILHAVALGWVALHLYPVMLLSNRWAAILSAAVLCSVGALALVGLVSAIRHAVAPWLRGVVHLSAAIGTTWLGLCGLYLVLDGDRSSVLPDPYNSWWIESLDLTLEAAYRLSYLAAAPLAAPAMGAMHAALAAAVAALCALCWIAAPRLDVVGVLDATDMRATARAELQRATPKAKRRAKLRRFGRGATALIWKALAEAEARHGRFWLALGWGILISIGVALAWCWRFIGTPEDTTGLTALILFGAAGAAGFSCMAGGSSGIGLGTEIRHATWLTRYPVSAPGILGATVGVPAVTGALVMLAVGLPSLLVAGPMRPLLAVSFAAALAVSLAVRGLRALIWLRFPPGPGSNTLTELLMAAAFIFPMGLAATVVTLSLATGWLPPLASVALAGMPCMVIAGLCWPASVRLLRRLEIR